MRQAGVTPGAVGSLHLHGTGTALGDPVEAGAAFAALRLRQKPSPDDEYQKRALTMAALKSRIGHTEAAAGACGLLSSLYALQQGVAPGQYGHVMLYPCSAECLSSLVHYTDTQGLAEIAP